MNRKLEIVILIKKNKIIGLKYQFRKNITRNKKYESF